MAKAETVTPMMKQFYDFKAKYPDAVMLFRCGDFYETYAEDAVVASEILGITLTRRNNGTQGKQTEMAGFPYHALDTYLPKLVRAGKRVAICDQLEDPKLAKKLVKRGVTELVTPGVATHEGVLSCRENNFLAAVSNHRGVCGLSLLDISTGEFYATEGTPAYVEKLLVGFSPKEILIVRGGRSYFESQFGTKWFTYELDDWMFAEEPARERLKKHFGVSNLKGFGVDHLACGIMAAGAVMHYLEMTQHTRISHITSLHRIEEDKYVRLDKYTVRSLELIGAMNEGGRSLTDVIDRTITPMGARMIRRWIVFPLKDVAAIKARQEVVNDLTSDASTSDTLSEQLHRVGDLERIASKVASGRVSPREIVQLKIALRAIEPIREKLIQSQSEGLRCLGEQLNPCVTLHERIEREVNPDPPMLVAKGGVISDGVNAELDELRQLAHNGKDYLLKIQQREIERTGIQSLKVSYNNVFGYFIEVRNTYRDLVPDDWIRRQTLVNAERYITDELKEYESKILGAEEKILSIETNLFAELVADVSEYIPTIQSNATLLAQGDCLLSFARVAVENGYVCPLVDDSDVIDIHGGRHPVIERLMPVGESYVPNDVHLDTETQQIVIITGPNMAGKSALLRQTALITLLAQIGSFVPAESARIGIVDKIFTRVGASDNISVGESTFMVEMNEAADILNNLSPRSLVLFDELGRGTSTYDGISIAWAIVEYIHEHATSRARTLFATHYHELNEMEAYFARIKNYNVSVREIDGHVVFLRRLERGGSEHSFGIHVARLAGMPRSIVARAEQILLQLESEAGRHDKEISNSAQDGNSSVESRMGKRLEGLADTRSGVQLSFFQLDDPLLSQIRDEILELDVNNLTPIEALNKLDTLKRLLRG